MASVDAGDDAHEKQKNNVASAPRQLERGHGNVGGNGKGRNARNKHRNINGTTKGLFESASRVGKMHKPLSL
jgi:hypothetical protein